jgi:hypothetical protein
MKNPFNITAQFDEVLEPHKGYGITATFWSNNVWTARISRKEDGTEHVIMDNDTQWEYCLTEPEFHEYIDEYLES